MNKLLIFSFLIVASHAANAQTKLAVIKDKINTFLLYNGAGINSSGESYGYQGNLAITDVEEVKGYFIVSGHYDIKVIVGGFFGSLKTCDCRFTTKLKLILDDAEIVCFKIRIKTSSKKPNLCYHVKFNCDDLLGPPEF